MKNLKIAINGLGRIGKLLFRELFDRNFNISIVNEIDGDIKLNSELLVYDSIHGKWKKDIILDNQQIIIDEKKVNFSSHNDLNKIDLKGVDIVIDCTGKHKDYETLKKYFKHGIKKIIVSAPIKDPNILNLVYGVNHQIYNNREHSIITGASCTTNCIAPIIKVVHENLGIKHGSITTIHNVTNSQTIIDKPSPNFRRSRSSMTNLIPTTTGSAAAINLIYPELSGKLNGHAVRVPVINSSLTDCVFEVKTPTSNNELNKLFHLASINELKNILGYEEKSLVSSDFINDPRSCVIDAESTMVVNKTQVKIYAWYDNEWGYVNRLADLTMMIGKSIC